MTAQIESPVYQLLDGAQTLSERHGRMATRKYLEFMAGNLDSILKDEYSFTMHMQFVDAHSNDD